MRELKFPKELILTDYSCIITGISSIEIELEKHKFCRHESAIFLKDVDMENVLVANKISSSGKRNLKYFIGYLHDDYKIKPLHIMLPKTRV